MNKHTKYNKETKKKSFDAILDLTQCNNMIDIAIACDEDLKERNKIKQCAKEVWAETSLEALSTNSKAKANWLNRCISSIKKAFGFKH